MQTEEKTLGYIRARQLDAVNRLTPAVMVCNIICAIGVNVVLWHSHAVLLVCWLCVLSSLSVLRFVSAGRFAKLARSRRSASPKAIRRATIRAAVSAIVSVAVPSWLLAQTTGSEFAFLLCLETGLFWAGGLVLATLVEAALAFNVVAATLIIAGILYNGLTFANIFISALICTAMAVTTSSARRQSAVLAQTERQQLDLQQQGDTIAILLKDYEEQTSDWLWELDPELRVRHPSQRFSEAMHLPVETIAQVPLTSLLSSPEVPGNEAATQYLRNTLDARRPFRELIVPFSRGTQRCWWSISGRPVHGDDKLFHGFRGVASDVTLAKQAEARLDYLAHHDVLTGLPNRTLFNNEVAHTLASPQGEHIALLSLDLDGFKPVNDRFGHPAGDALLIEVAERLRACIEDGDVVARFGGDEFVILDQGFSPSSSVEALCARVIDAISRPFDVSGEDVKVGVSIGVAFGATDGLDCEDLLKNADAALYRAKRDGRGTYRFYSAEMDRALLARQSLVQDLRSALNRQEFMLYYQPYVTSDDGTVAGCEALLRWCHPHRGMVSPVEFVPLAEESGLIVSIGAWVIEEACREAKRWPEHTRMSVNISPAQLRDRDLPRVILAALNQAQLSPCRFEVEVTETVLIDDPVAALDILRQIKALGVRVALDDFGTGYSSLSYLRSFPFDKIKIDRSFVQQLDTRPDSQVIVRAIRDIATGLGMDITAEGVETRAQAEQLRLTGCNKLQGFLFSTPQPPQKLDFGALQIRSRHALAPFKEQGEPEASTRVA